MDVLIVGGGPGGLFMAARLAERGVRTLVCEEHARVGDPVHCTGVLSADSFARFDLPASATLNQLTSVRFLSPGGIPVDYTTPSPLATVIDRPVFDRALADRALAAGAEIRARRARHGARGRRGRRRARSSAARPSTRASRCSPAAPPTSSSAGSASVCRTTYLHTAQRELPCAAVLGTSSCISGRMSRPGGFAWAVPVLRPEGACVRIGVMASRDIRRCYERMVERVRDRWGVTGDDVAPRVKILPLGAVGPHLRRSHAGDRRRRGTRQADHRRRHPLQHRQRARWPPTSRSTRWPTIGWTRGACRPTSARGATELADEFEAQQELREVATSLSDEAIDSFFELAHTDGIMPIVRATARFNEHRPLIRALFKHPPARRILFRAMIA